MLALFALAFMWDGFLNTTELCKGCGTIRQTPRFLWIPRQELEATELSRFYDETKESANHSHDWVFCQSESLAIRYVPGVGFHSMKAAESGDVRIALETIRKVKGDAEANAWFGSLLDPKTAEDALNAMLILKGGWEFNEAYGSAVRSYHMNRRAKDNRSSLLDRW